MGVRRGFSQFERMALILNEPSLMNEFFLWRGSQGYAPHPAMVESNLQRYA